MNRSVTFRPRARRDLLEQMLYLGQEAGTGARVAERYHHAVLTTCEMLADQPLSGRLLSTEIPRLQELRGSPSLDPLRSI
jgi:plasmid stabilization system protein ParE